MLVPIDLNTDANILALAGAVIGNRHRELDRHALGGHARLRPQLDHGQVVMIERAPLRLAPERMGRVDQIDLHFVLGQLVGALGNLVEGFQESLGFRPAPVLLAKVADDVENPLVLDILFKNLLGRFHPFGHVQVQERAFLHASQISA